MHSSLNPRSALLVLLSSLALSCSPTTRPDLFRTNFLPPAPAPAPAAAPAAPATASSAEPTFEPPSIHSSSSPREIPNFLKTPPSVPPRPQLDNRIRRADTHFQNGRKLYLEGDQNAARAEFDKAIELLLSSSDTAPDRIVAERKLEDLIDRIHRFDIEGLGAGLLEEQVSYDKTPLSEILELTFPIDPNIKGKVQEQVLATRSQLPLEENDEVLRYINFFNSDRGKRTLIAGLKRAGRYSPMIRRILDEEGVPQELIYLAQAESGFMPRALSPAAAAGMWQFVQFRGREYGLLQTPYSDDRLDPEKATRAGARHLRDLYQQFGDWYLAMAAYNCGPGCVSKAVQRTGYADFWKLRSLNALPRETTNYVPIIVAMTIMVKNSKDYGIEGIVPDPAIEYDTVEMVANTNLALVSDLIDVPLTELRDLNPALLRTTTPSGYALRIPKGSTQNLMAGLSVIPADKRASWRTHRLQDGESLLSVSKRYKVAPQNIASVNRANMDDLRTGDLLVIPAAYVEPAAPKSASRYAAKSRSNSRTASASRRPAPKPTATSSASRTARKVAPAPARKAPPKRGPAVAVRASTSSKGAR